MDYYNAIKNRLIDNKIYCIVKVYSKERYRIITYFQIDKLLYDAVGKYEDRIIDEY